MFSISHPQNGQIKASKNKKATAKEKKLITMTHYFRMSHDLQLI